jgi:hypothetical protein
MIFKDIEKEKQFLCAAISLLEKLGVCVAAFAGAGAIFKFAPQLFPFVPLLPRVIGLLLAVVSLLLAVLVVSVTWRTNFDYLKTQESFKRRWLLHFPVFLVIYISCFFFVLAGGMAALDALTSS